MIGMVEGDLVTGQRVNVISYDPVTGEIRQMALVKPHRVPELVMSGQVMILETETLVNPETQRINLLTETLDSRPENPLVGGTFTAGEEVDLSWCPEGAHLILYNEAGDVLDSILPMSDGLILTDPGAYTIILRGTFPYKEFMQTVEVFDA